MGLAVRFDSISDSSARALPLPVDSGFVDSTRTGANFGGGLPRCTVAMPRGLNYATGGGEQRYNAVGSQALFASIEVR